MFNQASILRSTRKAAAAVLLTSCSLLAFASMGGGEKNKKKTSFLSEPSPLYATFRPGMSPFSLKSTFNYRGSQILSQEKMENFVMLNSVVTYRNGNTIHILPYKQKVILQKFKTPTPVPTVNR